VGGPSGTTYTHPNHSGDVTSVADGAQTLVATAGVNAAALAAAVLVGAISDAEVAKAPVHHEVYQALLLKAPSTGIALSALANQAALTALANITGGVAAPTAITATQLFYNLIMSIAMTAHGAAGATETFDMTTAWNHSVTLDTAATTFSITDPGCTGCPVLFIRITDDDAAVTLTWQKTGGGGTFKWAGGSGVYDVIIKRVAADTYDCSYVTMGW
jgi:hypothetical protein